MPLVLMVIINILFAVVAGTISKGQSEFLLAMQTLVYADTGLIVYWYTKETQRIREASKAQTELLERQLGITNDMFEAARQERERLLSPTFDFAPGGLNSDGVLSLRLRNLWRGSNGSFLGRAGEFLV